MAASRERDAHVLVIGAGLAGLAAAHRLEQDGLRALVVEREPRPGGRVRSEEWQGCTIELGANFVVGGCRRLRDLIEACGLGARLDPMPNAFRIAIRRDARWHHLDLRRPEIELARYRGIGWREKASLVRLLPSQLRAATSLRFFDMASATAVDSGRLDAVIGPGANRYFAGAVSEVFCGYPPEQISLAFGVLGTRYPLRRAWIMRGGLGSLTDELARLTEPRCGVAVERVRVESGGVVVETRGGDALRAGAAVVATRAQEARELWSDAPEATRRFLEGQSYTQGFGVFLRTSTPAHRPDPRGRQLYMEIVPWAERRALLAVIYQNETAPDGGLVGLAASPDAAAAGMDDAELAAQLEAELAELHPELPPQITARRAVRWPVLVPSYPPGRARELAAFRAGFAPGPVQLAGDYLYGPLTEAAVRSGQDAAGHASRYMGAGL